MARYISNNVCMDSVVKVAAPAGIAATVLGIVVKPILTYASNKAGEAIGEMILCLDKKMSKKKKKIIKEVVSSETANTTSDTTKVVMEEKKKISKVKKVER